MARESGMGKGAFLLKWPQICLNSISDKYKIPNLPWGHFYKKVLNVAFLVRTIQNAKINTCK